ncbi:hypothetical protein [Hymenobacter cavernae]|uniref:hypothetical protein n=1 Tax=Hymenobacter cavernae TaxID=2044852 RepID=UPI001663A836|nr:hypothetical protein [Hymenobacter cavernae]
MQRTSLLKGNYLINHAKYKVWFAQMNDNKFIDLVISRSWMAMFVAIIYQSAYFPDLSNLFAIGCIVFVWFIFTKLFFRAGLIREYPLSFFMILCFVVTQFCFPLLFTSLEQHPVVFNLVLPYQVFFHSTAAFIVLLLTHALYRTWFKQTTRNTPRLFIKLGFFDVPADLQLWLMGVVGLAATFYAYLYSPASIAWQVGGASAGDKAVQALLPFSYAPFYIPFSRLYGKTKPSSGSLVPMLVAYTLLLFIISIARNNRSGFMVGFSSAGFTYALGLLLGTYKIKFFTLRNCFIALSLGYLLTGPMADIGTAMVIVRGQRYDLPYSELIAETFQVFSDKQAIQHYRLLDTEEADPNGWDERYLKNIFLSRFCNIKYNDNSLVQAEKIWEYNPAMLKFSIDYVWAVFPQPVLNILGMTEIDKVKLKGISFGDYLYYTAGAPSEVLGGYRLGHFAGTGMASFGWWYLLLFGVGMLPVFFLIDKFCMAMPASATPQEKNSTGTQLRFSLCGLLILDYIFHFMQPETVLFFTNFLLRDWLQQVFLYFVMYQFTRVIVWLVSGNAAKPSLPRFHSLSR